MHTLQIFYQWLTPSVSFEFIKHRSSDECASLLAGQVANQTGPRVWRLKIDVTPQPNPNYQFVVKRNLSAMFVVESRGSISALDDDYSLVKGLATARPVLALFLLFLMTCVFTLLTIGSAITSADQPLASVGAVVVITLIILFDGVILRAWKWTMIMYVD